MSYINTSSYDTYSAEGQNSIIEDVLNEFNNQVLVTQTAGNFQIVAYGKSSNSPIPYNPGQIFTKSITHNLGYPPIFLVLSFFTNKYNGENGFFSFPYYDGSINFWAESDPINLNVNLQYNSGVFLDAYTYEFAYYIFNQPGIIR